MSLARERENAVISSVMYSKIGKIRNSMCCWVQGVLRGRFLEKSFDRFVSPLTTHTKRGTEFVARGDLPRIEAQQPNLPIQMRHSRHGCRMPLSRGLYPYIRRLQTLVSM